MLEKLPSGIPNTTPDKVTRLYNQYVADTEARANADNLSRMRTAQRYFRGVGMGQWSQKALQIAMEKNRPIHTLNVIQEQVKKVAGSIIKNPYTIKFTPTGSMKSGTQSNIMNHLWEYDHERSGFRQEWIKFVLDVLIHTGVMQLYPDYRHDSDGNISFRRINPFSVILDPAWQSENIAECRRASHFSWLTITQIKDIARANKIKNETIDEYYRMAREQTEDSSNSDASVMRDASSSFCDVEGGRYKVLEIYEMVERTRTRVKDTKKDEFVEELDGRFREDPDVFWEQKQNSWMNAQGPGQYKIVQDTEHYCKMTMIVPGLSYDLILSEGGYPIQTGSLPFIVKSCINMDGERQGIVEQILDAQDILNKRESSASEILEKTSSRNFVIEGDVFGGDQDAEDDFRKRVTGTGGVFKVMPGKKEGIKELETPRPPQQLWSASDRALQMMKILTSTDSDAFNGQTSHSNESSVLFADKREQAAAGHQIVVEALADARHQIGNLYFYAVKDLYAYRPMKLINPSTDKAVFINQLAVPESGSPVMLNDITSLPRHMIMVKESPMGMTNQKRVLGMYGEFVSRTTNPLLKAEFEVLSLDYIDGISEEKKEKLKEHSEIYLNFLKTQIMANTKQLEAQLQPPAPQMPGQEGPGGAPMDAKQAANLPGMGPIPAEAALAGNQGAANNAPTDMGARSR